MVVHKKKKVTKYRAHTTHGGGHRKKRRGAGSRGGRGNAGSGKRAGQKKAGIKDRTLGNKGFSSKSTKNERIINVGYFTLEKVNKLLEKGSIKKENDFWDFLLIEHLAKPVIWFMANFTKLTPTNITVLSFILFALTSALAFATGHLITGAILSQIFLIFDLVDGRVAQLKNLKSNVGRITDAFVDLLMIIGISLSLGYYVYSATGNLLTLALSGIYVIIVLLIHVLYLRSYVINGNKVLMKKVTLNERSLISKVKVFLSKRRIRLGYTDVETNAIIFFIAPILAVFFGLKLIHWAFILGISLLAILFIVFFALQIKTLKKDSEANFYEKKND